MRPEPGDYVQLLDGLNQPCENFTLVGTAKSEMLNDIFFIEDRSGEAYFIRRKPEQDTDVRKGWVQVVMLGRHNLQLSA